MSGGGRNVESIPWHELGEPERTLRVGEEVWDDLTATKARVLRIETDEHTEHTVGIWLDNDYVGGGRHPWEITKLGEVHK